MVILLAMNFPKRDYSESHGADDYRRALYTEWQRTFLHPTLRPSMRPPEKSAPSIVCCQTLRSRHWSC